MIFPLKFRRKLKSLYLLFTGPVLDVDWRTNVSFATSSTDHMIYVCKIGETQPIKAFSGHQVCLVWVCYFLAYCSTLYYRCVSSDPGVPPGPPRWSRPWIYRWCLPASGEASSNNFQLALSQVVLYRNLS